MWDLKTAVVLAASAPVALAQFGGGGNYGGSNNPYNNGGDNGGDDNGGSGSSFGGGSSSSRFGPPASVSVLITAHAVLASLAFVVLFPIGGIIVRLASFRGLWWIHGLFQIFAYFLYIAAFAIGIYLATQARMLHLTHPIIGIVLFVLLFFQPILGYLHHAMFKKHSRRVVWSYGHIWLGRGIIVLGIVNGGLGLQLAQRTRAFAPSSGAVIAYSVVAGVIGLIYLASIIFGEIKRKGSSAKGDVVRPSRGEKRRPRRERRRRGDGYESDRPQYA